MGDNVNGNLNQRLPDHCTCPRCPDCGGKIPPKPIFIPQVGTPVWPYAPNTTLPPFTVSDPPGGWSGGSITGSPASGLTWNVSGTVNVPLSESRKGSCTLAGCTGRCGNEGCKR